MNKRLPYNQQLHNKTWLIPSWFANYICLITENFQMTYEAIQVGINYQRKMIIILLEHYYQQLFEIWTSKWIKITNQLSHKSVKQNGIQNFLSQCLDFFHMLNTSNVKLNHFTLLSKIQLHRLTTFNMRLIAMTRILLQWLLWYTWKYYELWNTWPQCDIELYTKYVVLLLNSQGTLKKYRTQYTLHDPPAYRKFSSYSFQKRRVKITTKCALYFRHTIPHVHHPTAY